VTLLLHKTHYPAVISAPTMEPNLVTQIKCCASVHTVHVPYNN